MLERNPWEVDRVTATVNIDFFNGLLWDSHCSCETGLISAAPDDRAVQS